MMSPNKLHLECSLDKELYYHGETISVNVHIQVSFSELYCVIENELDPQHRLMKEFFIKAEVLPLPPEKN